MEINEISFNTVSYEKRKAIENHLSCFLCVFWLGGVFCGFFFCLVGWFIVMGFFCFGFFIFLIYWNFFPLKTKLFTESVLYIGSVFIWFVLSSVHVYALFTFLQNIPSVWKDEFSMLTSNKG